MVTPPAEKQRRCLHMPSASRGWAGRLRDGCIARIWPEHPERYLSEIIWVSKPDCGISTMQKASPNLRPPGPRTEQRTEQR